MGMYFVPVRETYREFDKRVRRATARRATRGRAPTRGHLTTAPRHSWQHRGVTTPMSGQIPGVQPEELPSELPGGGIALLDVRESNEWAAGHAPGAVHVPMSEIPQRLDDLPEADQIYVVCRSGGRSGKVTAYLNANGWDAVNVERGMNGWSAIGRQLVSDEHDDEPYVL